MIQVPEARRSAFLGWAEFCGLRIAVDPGVFVPRRRIEFLVRQAAALARPGAVIVDLCCGSGAVGVALVAALGQAELHAVDIDPLAVRCARAMWPPPVVRSTKATSTSRCRPRCWPAPTSW